MKNQGHRGNKAAMAGMVGALVFFILGSQALAGGNRSMIQVSAIVQPTLHQTVVSEKRALVVTPQDIRRGYIEVPAAAVMSIETNSREGYYLNFVVDQSIAREVWVTEGGKTTVVSGGIGSRHQDYPGEKGELKRLGLRFILSPDVAPGTYLWPLEITASLI